MKKRRAKKKSRAFRIHSKMSRYEMPNKLKKMIIIIEMLKHLPIGFNSGWYGGKRTQRTPYDSMIESALYLIPASSQYFFAA